MEGYLIIHFRLWADIKPTEDLEKVRLAFKNLCPPITIDVSKDLQNRTILTGSATGPESIATLGKKFREQRILEAVRKRFMKSIQNGVLIFWVQRQAAFMNRFHLSDENDVSGMGPIRVEIQATNLHDVIDYVAPPTVKGKPQFRKDLKLE
ncbi:MAG: RNA-binding domain-containing protein [Promethearchaeota archaeon]